MWKRFPIPEFDRTEFKNMEWTVPAYLSQADIGKLIDGRKSGDSSVYGCYPVMPDEAFFAKLGVRGDQRHAVMCVLPDQDVRIVGRSWAWAIQRASIVDSLDSGGFNVIADWKTSRPMNTRLGPDDGISRMGGVLYAVCSRGYGDHWIGNRTIAQNGLSGAEGRRACRVLSASVDDQNDFHDCTIGFEWTA